MMCQFSTDTFHGEVDYLRGNKWAPTFGFLLVTGILMKSKKDADETLDLCCLFHEEQVGMICVACSIRSKLDCF